MANPFEAAQSGYAFGNQLYEDRTRKVAGSAFASGDYSGAANAFARGGMINEAAGVQDYQTKRQDHATDVAAAARTEKGKWLVQAAQGLTYVPAARRQQEFQTHIAPVMKAMSIPDEVIAQIASSPMDDQSLHSFISAFGGTPDMSAHKGDWKEVKNADGSSRFEFFPADPYQQQPQATAPAPAPEAAAPQAQPPEQPQATAESGGGAYLARLGQIESNNDPNARNGSSTGLYQFHPDTFARLGGTDINDPEQQKAAALKLAQESARQLQSAGIQPDDASLYIMHQQGAGGGLALLKADPNANAIATLTPVYGNPTRARQAIVNNGGSADMTAGQFVDMWRQKWGRGAQQPAQPYQVASAGETPPPPSQGPQAASMASGGMFSRPGSAAKPKDAPSGYRWTADGKSLEAIPGGPASPGVFGDAANSNLSGEAFLATLPKTQQAQVKALAEGRMQFPGGFALKSPYWQNMISAVSQYDPTFDTVNYNARNKVRAAFTSGPDAQNIAAMNTAIGHMGTLATAVAGLQNTGIPWVNGIKNWYENNTGDPRVKRFEVAKTAVANELTRVFRGTGGSVKDVTDWEAVLNAADSPEQLNAAISQGVDLLKSRLDALNEKYTSGMGTTAVPLQFLTPKAQTTLDKLGGDGQPSAPRTKGSPLPPQAVSKLTPGHITTFANGQSWTLRGGKPVRVK